jgi:hypothetical protein
MLDEGSEIVHVGDDIDSSSENDSCVDISDEADNCGERTGLPSVTGVAPLSMDSDEDTWLI